MNEPILIERRPEFPGRKFRPVAAEMWRALLRGPTDSCDLAHWMVDPDSATIRLTPRNSHQNESDPTWPPPLPIVAIVDGIVERFSSDETENAALKSKFRGWAIDGIIAALESADITRRLEKSDYATGSFGVVVSPHDEGLEHDELEVIWSNDNRLKPAKIKSRQRTSHSGAAKKVKLRKAKR